MAKVKGNKVMGVTALYTHDSPRFHVYQICNDNMVGTIYVSKDLEAVPKKIDFDMLTANDENWRAGVEILMEGARPGSKAKAKLKRALDDNTH